MKRLALALLCGALSLGGARAAIDQALDNQLAELLARAYDHPESSEKLLRDLQRSQPAERQGQLEYAEARLWMMAGETAKVKQWVAQHQGPQARFLQGLLDEREGRELDAMKAAEDVAQLLAGDCKDWQGPRLQQLGCDFRLARDALRLQGRVLQRRAQLGHAQAVAERALALARAGQDDELAAHDLAELAELHDRQDQHELARQALGNAQRLAQSFPRMAARIKSYEAVMAVRRGDRTQARQALEEGMALARQADAPRIEALLEANVADQYLNTRHPDQARKHAEAALPVLQKFGEPRALRNVRHNLAVALIQLRAFDAARQQIDIIERLPVGDEDATHRADELRELGEAWAGVGQAKEALALYHAERRLTLDAQQRAREAVLSELRAKYDADAQKAQVELLRRERAVQEQTLGNQSTARQVTVIGAVLLGLCGVIAVLALARMRKAHRHLRANQALLKVLSERDPLTQLANRRHFQSAMQARGDQPLTGGLLMLDIDHFKRINDSHGHGAGDKVIQTVASRLQATLRDGDLLVRWGGEEFLILAPTLRASHVQLLAERLLGAVGGTPVPLDDGTALRVTISIGFACFPMPPAGLSLHWERAINWADLALYAAKHRGRNRAVGAVEAQADDEQSLARIESDFEGAAAAARIKLTQVIGPIALST